MSPKHHCRWVSSICQIVQNTRYVKISLVWSLYSPWISYRMLRYLYISLIYTIWVSCHLLIRVSCHLNSNIYYMYTYFMNYYGIFFSGLNMLYLLGMTVKVLPWREWVSLERPDQIHAVSRYHWFGVYIPLEYPTEC